MSSHAWTTSNNSGMHIEDADAVKLYDLPAVLSHFDAERFVEGLRKFDVQDIGSSVWMEQHRRLEQLNIQAHHNAMTNSDEYVLEAILTFNKLEVLIHNLIVIELWKENVYPELLDRIAGRNNMRTYFILHHEAVLVNLFEVLLYHKHVCEAGGERMIELVDYVARKLTRLSSGYDFRLYDPSSHSKTAVELAKDIESRSPKEELAQHLTEIEFKICISAVALGRFLCEHADAMPLSVVSRITDTHDMVMLFLPLIENPPWTRRLSNGKWQKLIDQKWSEVPPIDLLKVTKLEGQPWIAIYHLLAKQVFRERYHLNSFRKGQVLRVRKYINELLLDQLPFLADIQRYMDELAITEVPEPLSLGSGVFMFQQVAVMREKLMKGKNWAEVADYQFANVFVMTDKSDPDLRAMAELYADDLVDGVLEPTAAH